VVRVSGEREDIQQPDPVRACRALRIEASSIDARRWRWYAQGIASYVLIRTV